MWKGPTIPMTHVYPFGVLPQNSPKTLVLKRVSSTPIQSQKTRLLSSLKHDTLIKLQQTHPQKSQTLLFFQYIPQSLQKWSVNVSRQFIENYEQRMILLSRYLADKGICIVFRKENMGVMGNGDAKYYVEPGFQVDGKVEKYGLKKKYKEQIRSQIQQFIDKKNYHTKHIPVPVKQVIPQKKQNTKILKILQAIQKGKANLCSQPTKQSQKALVPHNNQVIPDPKPTIKPIKNIQNVIISHQINKVNKIQVMVNNQAVETFQQQFKRQYASSSFYINGMQTAVVQKQGQTKRLLSPNDKFARFQEVKYKEYKSMKTSGEMYVQDFIDVLEAEDASTTGGLSSPRATIKGMPRIMINNSPRTTFKGSPPARNQIQSPPQRLAIEEQKKEPAKSPQFKKLSQPHTPQFKPPQPRKLPNPPNPRIDPQTHTKHNLKPSDSNHLSTSQRQIKPKRDKSNANAALQKKVSDAIANSLNVINRFKNAKIQG